MNREMFDHEKALRLLVCGSRDFTNKKKIEEVLKGFQGVEVLVHGNARGADQIAGLIGMNLWGDDKVRAFLAKWTQFGPSAGAIRNKQMLDEGKPNRVLAFFHNMNFSPGTIDMVYQSLQSGLVRIVWCWDEQSQRQFYADRLNRSPRSPEDLIA